MTKNRTTLPGITLLLLVFLMGFSFKMDKRTVRIVLMGDSITKGERSGVHSNQIYSWYLSDRLNRQHLTAEVVNEGSGGENVSHANARMQTSAIDKHPDIVALMYGTNDSFIDPGNDTARVTLPVFEQTLNQMVRKLKANGIHPLLLSPPPLWKFQNSDREPYVSHGLNFSLQQYVLAARRVALIQEIPFIDVFHNWLLRLQSGQDLNNFYVDGMHPSFLGHLLIADLLLPEIQQEINRLQNPAKETDWPGLLFRSDQQPLEYENSLPIITPLLHELILSKMPDKGNYSVSAEISITPLTDSHFSFNIGSNYVDFRRKDNLVFFRGPSFEGDAVTPADSMNYLDKGSFLFKFILSGDTMQVFLNKELIYKNAVTSYPAGRMSFSTRAGNLKVHTLSMEGALVPAYKLRKNFSIPVIDLSGEKGRQIIVDKEKNQYLGHPTTVLLDNHTTMIAVYPKGHGKGAIVMKESEDEGRTWSNRLPVPENWATSKEVPTLYKMTDKKGQERLILFSGLYPIRMAISENEGKSWTPLKPIGNFGGIVAMSDVIRLKNGNHMAFFHDDGRFISKNGKKSNTFFVYSTVSSDGGLTWSYPEIVTHLNGAGLCEPGVIRSPDGKRIAMLLRENFRRLNSMIIFSDDEGKTWTSPRELPASLTGDRHQLAYTPDGRIVAVFRDMAQDSPYKGDFVAWVGTWNDLETGGEGAYRVRLLDNKDRWDCGYPGLEVLPDGMIVATTYGHWEKNESPYIISVRFKLDELDKKAKSLPVIKDVYINGEDGYPAYRIPAVITTKKGTILAFCEGRSSLSDHAENDIVLKRSLDGGMTWSALKIVEEKGAHSLNNPTVVQDESSGKIFLMYQDYPAEHGPYAGRLVIPFNQGPYNHWKVYTVYSDDHGKRWSMGEVVPDGAKGLGNEVQVVELNGGNLLLNSRSSGGDYYRKKSISTDGGITWSPLIDVKELPEPQCQGTILRFNFADKNKSGRILFANPASQTKRSYGTLQLSYDDGVSWPVSKLIYNGPYAYSCLTRINANTIGLLFEKDNYQKISFSIISIKWLENK